MLLDLPEPLGPMMEVKYESPKGSTCLPRYVLKSAGCEHLSRLGARAQLTVQLEAHELPHGGEWVAQGRMCRGG